VLLSPSPFAAVESVALRKAAYPALGKVLDSVGLFTISLKFWKRGLLALADAWAGIKQLLGFGQKES
jgi:hypothetical protein